MRRLTVSSSSPPEICASSRASLKATPRGIRHQLGELFAARQSVIDLLVEPDVAAPDQSLAHAVDGGRVALETASSCHALAREAYISPSVYR